MGDDELFWPPLSGSEPATATGEPAQRGSEGDPDVRRTEPLTFGGERPTATLADPATSGERPPRRWTTAAVVAATAFVFGGGGVAIGAEVVNGNGGSSNPTSAGFNVSNVAPTALSASPNSFAAIAAKVLPSVVSINVTGPNESDTGSGIILRSNGYILTNNHVVAAAESGGSVSVTFNDGSSSSARIVGTDSLDDLAVIKVSKSGLRPATLGNSSAIQVGDPVLAVGSPLGLSGTVTQGIVSALNRPVETQPETQPQQINPFGLGGSTPSTQQPTVIDAIQTDAAINPGNSGGALVDAAGQVIGINSAIASLSSAALGSQSGNIGVGFAIPIDQARVIAAELINTGHATHPLLGVTLTDATSSSGVARALVHSVAAGTPAASAGLKEGDVITAIDGQKTAGSDAVIAAIRAHQPGQQISVTYERGGTTKTVRVTLANQSASKG
jgi:putative serine protease PepD